jgi:hypothetical protein
MKVFKNIIICIMISLIIQIGVLFYLNYYFLVSNASVKTKKVLDSNNGASSSQINVPDNAINVSLSYDGSYIAYYLNDALYVFNTKSGKSIDVNFSDSAKISFYKWLPDRNRMLIAEKKNGNLSLSYYDVDKAQMDMISQLESFSSMAEVKDIEAAPLPNVIYTMVSTGDKRDVIYWINIMRSKKKIKTWANNIGNIRVIPHEDIMVYEDLTNNKVYSTGTNSALTFYDSPKLCLLGIDNNDQVYIGDMDSNNNIEKIYFGTLKESTSNWQTLQLSTPVRKANLFVTASGKAYKNDDINGTITELQTGKETPYKGIFLQSYNDMVASISDGILVKTHLD